METIKHVLGQHTLLALHTHLRGRGSPQRGSHDPEEGFGIPEAGVRDEGGTLGCGPGELDPTHHHEHTLVLRVSTVAAQETKNKEHSAGSDEEVAHVDKLHGTR